VSSPTRSELERVPSSCKHSNEPSSAIEGDEPLVHLDGCLSRRIPCRGDSYGRNAHALIIF
jgi:hypothetical protein